MVIVKAGGLPAEGNGKWFARVKGKSKFVCKIFY